MASERISPKRDDGERFGGQLMAIATLPRQPADPTRFTIYI